MNYIVINRLLYNVLRSPCKIIHIKIQETDTEIITLF